jgi:hypothetical protein
MTIINLPAGQYVIGDLCYREEWDDIIDYGSVVNGALRDGRRYAYMQTQYGDGSYIDQSGKDYYVDSGTIGIMEYDGNLDSPMGRTYKFENEFTCEKNGAILRFGNVVIDTDPEHDEMQYDDYQDDNPLEEEF